MSHKLSHRVKVSSEQIDGGVRKTYHAGKHTPKIEDTIFNYRGSRLVSILNFRTSSVREQIRVTPAGSSVTFRYDGKFKGEDYLLLRSIAAQYVRYIESSFRSPDAANQEQSPNPISCA